MGRPVVHVAVEQLELQFFAEPFGTASSVLHAEVADVEIFAANCFADSAVS